MSEQTAVAVITEPDGTSHEARLIFRVEVGPVPSTITDEQRKRYRAERGE